MIKSDSIFGLVLAGGKSNRMGSDKSLIEYYGKPQREYLFDLLSQCCSKVYTSCKNNDDVPSFLNPLPDQFEIESPLNGILSAFTLHSDAAWLTVPVDMPLINQMTFDLLTSNRDKSKVATCFYDSDGKNPEPLLTLWEPKGWSSLFEFYSKGKISPRDFLKQSDINLIRIPDSHLLLNINSKEELDEFLKKK